MENAKDNLIFSLDTWPETGVTCEFALSPSLLAPYLRAGGEENAEPPNLLTSLRGNLELCLTGKTLHVKGVFAVKVEMICARCLATFVGKVGDAVDDAVELGLSGESFGDDELEPLIPVRGGSFDLTPLICEFFWLSWPIKAVCKPDCPGLCPECGANLNDGPCGCGDRAVTRH
ncbi:MAG: DUF177 domain-containing protein [Deltaproteobacteria bacterium]|jgi:hypothetical protein|nr:DUF177 domain-containing protein [Deltaproteobacteria bacterium]